MLGYAHCFIGSEHVSAQLVHYQRVCERFVFILVKP
jgi:hypothetical protein